MAALPISVDYKSAAEMTGHSVDVIRRAVRAGDLTPRYPTAKPVLLVEDLRAWVLRAPTERGA
jgi:hypothetical protein